MKLRYFNYFFYDADATPQKFYFSISSIFNNFSRNAPTNLKKSFVIDRKKYYLIPEGNHDNLYYFITANDSDLIKSIDTENLNLTDIQERLHANESLGSYAYIMVSDALPVVSILSTFGSPRIDAFSLFSNLLFTKLAPTNTATLNFSPLMRQATSSQIDSLELIASAGFIVNNESSMFSAVKELFGDDTPDDSIGEFKITVSRKDGSNISSFARHLVTKASGENTQISQLNVRGKPDAITGAMTDYLLDMNQQITDEINKLRTRTIEEQISEKAPVNPDITQASTVFCEEENINLADEHILLSTCSARDVYQQFITPAEANQATEEESNG